MNKHALVQESILLMQTKHIYQQDILFPKEIKLVKKQTKVETKVVKKRFCTVLNAQYYIIFFKG